MFSSCGEWLVDTQPKNSDFAHISELPDLEALHKSSKTALAYCLLLLPFRSYLPPLWQFCFSNLFRARRVEIVSPAGDAQTFLTFASAFSFKWIVTVAFSFQLSTCFTSLNNFLVWWD
jgi:hypothetical protein